MISILRGSEAEEKVEQYINFLSKSSVFFIYLFIQESFSWLERQ